MGLVAAAVGVAVVAAAVEQGTSSFTYQASVTRSTPVSLFLMISLEVKAFNVDV